MGAVSVDHPVTCECGRYADLANIPMGFDGDHERFLATVEEVVSHGGDAWWLWLGQCSACQQNWMIAQDDRIFDEFLITRLRDGQAQSITQSGDWPSDFVTYEAVLRELSKRCHFPVWFDLNDSPLALTITELRRANPKLSLEEAATLVGLDCSQLATIGL